jgi:uncharacterized protein
MKQIFINLPVENLEKSMNFYNQLGFSNYALFTGNNQKCVVWSEHIFVMLQSKEFFSAGNKKPITDTKNNIATSFTLPVESLHRVNEIIESGLKAGGTTPMAMLDEGFMQVRSIEDLDGHVWNIIYLDIDTFKELKENP